MAIAAPRHPRHRRRFAAAAVAALGLLGGCGGAGQAERPAGQPYSTQAVAEQLRTFEPTPVDLLGDGAAPAPTTAASTRQGRQPAAAGARGAGPAADPTQTLYHLNPQDVLGISVWREEELQRQVSVQPDGSVSFPLVGQIAAAGRTLDEVQAEITRRIDRFIPDAVVTVELLDARGNKIYVMGEVNRPGEYQLSAPLSVVQVIGLAGGFTQYAATDRIRVLRKGAQEAASLTINYDRIASGRGGATNVELKAGDTIIVPEQRLFPLF